MAEIEFIKPSVEIFFDPQSSRWMATVNDKLYRSSENFDKLIQLLVDNTVISESDAHRINKQFNNKGHLITRDQ